MATRSKTGGARGLWAVLAVIVAGALVWIGASGRDGGQPSAPLTSDAQLGADRNAMGKETAPVTVIEYGDYQ